MLLVAVRAFILFAMVVVVMRVMGKRQIGQLQPYELVITIIIAELAVIPMSNTGIPLTNGIIGILVLLSAEIFLSLVNMHSEKARGVICGVPTVLIENGKPVTAAMQNLRINMSDLMEQLRNKEYPNISDVLYAILETNGNLSVIPRPEIKPPTAKDMGVKVTQPRLPVTLITDGQIHHKNLRLANISPEELQRLAQASQISNLRDVLLAQLNSCGQIDFFKR